MFNPFKGNTLHVILCKGESSSQEEDEYVKSLRNLNIHNVSSLHLLQFTWKNISQLASLLGSPENFSGLIFTSVRAVNAIKHCIDSHFHGSSDILKSWTNKHIFCVGPKTMTEAQRQLGLKHNLPTDCAIGNVASLVECIASQDINFSKPLLFPCSSIANPDGPKLLEQRGIDFQVIHVYDTLPISDANIQFQSLIESLPMELTLFIVFFSPSNFRAIFDSVKHSLNDRKMKFIALGPATMAALQSGGIQVESTLIKPTPESLCDVIKSYL